MYYIVGMVLLIISALGVVELLHSLDDFLYHKKGQEHKIIVIPAKGTLDDMEYRVRRINAQNRWQPKQELSIYILDLGLSKESVHIVQLLQREIGGITLCSEQDFPLRLEQNLHTHLTGWQL